VVQHGKISAPHAHAGIADDPGSNPGGRTNFSKIGLVRFLVYMGRRSLRAIRASRGAMTMAVALLLVTL
jgi:hypothetical protein